jgi:hypothetical protein
MSACRASPAKKTIAFGTLVSRIDGVIVPISAHVLLGRLSRIEEFRNASCIPFRRHTTLRPLHRRIRRIRWDIDQDVIRGRTLDLAHKFLPDGLSLVDELPFLSASEQRFLSQVQGRTYANMFGLVERFVSAKVLDLTRQHALGDQVALEALIRFSDEELKHQELFRRIERLAAQDMPAGYRFDAQPNDVAGFVLGKRTWAVLAVICQLELFSQAHYRASIGIAPDLSALFKDVFLYHWREESQHAILDELEWIAKTRASATPSATPRSTT